LPRAGAGVAVGRPRVVVAAGVGERGDRVARPVVAGRAQAGALELARLDGDRRSAAAGASVRLDG